MPDLDRSARTVLINKAAHFLFPMAAMPFLSAWYFGVMPEDSRRMVFGGNIVMTLFMGLATGASVLIGLYAAFALLLKRLYINGATATLLLALSFAATAGGEFVREGVRKPYSIREALYSNSLAPEEIARLRKEGCVARDPYPLRNAEDYPNDQVRLGAKVFRFHCSVCHTMKGTNAVVHLAGDWTATQKRMNLSQLQRTKTFMPPFAGTPRELEALVRLIEWEVAGKPREWPVTSDPEGLRQIQAWMDEVGTEPGYLRVGGKR
jgi:mono/diheme cytochrome c family protein